MLFDSTVRREVARSFGATLVVILTIVITMMLIRTLGQAANGLAAPEDVVLLLGYTALQHIPTMLALSLFIAVVVSLGRMYRDSEMVIWFSSGIGLARIVAPVLRMAWPVLLVVGVLLLFVWPWANRSGTELRQRYEQRSDLSRVAPGVFQTSRDGNRVFFVDRASHEGSDGHNVFILTRKGEVESVTAARSGRLEMLGDDRMLVLESGQRNEVNSSTHTHTLASFDSYRVLADDGSVRRATERPAKTLATLELMRQPTPRNQGELAWRFGLLLAAGNLVLLGVGLAATNPRRASNWNLLFALMAFIVYFNMINLSQAWIGAERVGMGPMMLLLHGGAFSMALLLIWWRDYGKAMMAGARGHRAAAGGSAA
ncbi:LPS export ABC transporter permease LptF [Aquabacterium sp.]|uniref:LPS export ABC transporter permease LptF n=1 Tax=Aquabacterium sp. TaxID=1872578 RepID=UPI003783CF8A